jgi:hypothetical protein
MEWLPTLHDILCVSCHYNGWVIVALRLLSLPAVLCIVAALVFLLLLHRVPSRRELVVRYVKHEGRDGWRAAVDSAFFTALLVLPLQFSGPVAIGLYAAELGAAHYYIDRGRRSLAVTLLEHALHGTLYPYLFFLFVGAWVDIPLSVPVLDAVIAVVIGSVASDLTSSSVNLLLPELGPR